MSCGEEQNEQKINKDQKTEDVAVDGDESCQSVEGKLKSENKEPKSDLEHNETSLDTEVSSICFISSKLIV